jgi:hypothetical protein
MVPRLRFDKNVAARQHCFEEYTCTEDGEYWEQVAKCQIDHNGNKDGAVQVHYASLQVESCLREIQEKK